MGILDKLKAKTNNYIKLIDAIELVAKVENETLPNVATLLLHYDFHTHIPCYYIDSRYVVHSYDGLDNFNEDWLFLSDIEKSVFFLDEEIPQNIKEKYESYYWLKSDFFNFEPIKELNLLGSKDGSSKNLIDQIIERIDLVELINNYVPLKKEGKDYTACCPFHQEKSPSFSVSRENDMYHCYGCGAQGNAIDFLMKTESREFVDVIKDLAKRANVELPDLKAIIDAMPNEQFGVATIGAPDAAHYMRHRDQLQIELNMAKHQIAELQSQLESVNATSCESLTGIKAINAKKRDAQGMARIFASHLWSETTYKDVLIGVMADKVYKLMVVYCRDQLPENAESLKTWIRSAAPQQAQRKGRPSNKTVT